MKTRRRIARFTAIASAIALTAGFSPSEEKSPWGIHDKAFYADENLINFVRPGLVFTITSASIAADGTIRTRVKVTDPRGVPLEREGINTPGPIAMSFVAGTIPRNGEQYVSYVNRTQTSPITGVSAVQPTGENNGTFRLVEPGLYEYTFRTRAPANIDRTATHSIGVFGSRNLSEFDLGTNYDDFVYNFIPDGGDVTQVRDIVTNESCNTCHGKLAFHGGPRSSIPLCVMCHTQGVIDPDTGESVDMKIMVHKIHMGRNLPRVRAGGRYIIIGFRQSVHDFSGIKFPADNRQCNQCHDGEASQAQNYVTNPKRESCGSCHENVNWASGVGHAGGPQPNDNACARCHIPEGEFEFDASIRGAHTIPTQSRDLPGVNFKIVGVDAAQPGARPTIRFQITDDKGNVTRPVEMNQLNVIMAGPTTDYTLRRNESALAATTLPDGQTFSFTMTQPIPEGSTGTFAFGIEGNRTVVLQPGTTKEVTVRDAGLNQVFYANVEGGAAAPRRQVVALANCNLCHTELAFHGVNRNNVDVCVMCHNPTLAGRNSQLSVNFANTIHRVHLEGTYPNLLNRCTACHIEGTQNLPGKAVASVSQPAGPLNPIPPQTSACTSCHTSIAAYSHAVTNTSNLGEACVVCHGPNATFSVNRVHAE
jgi:OmcA/MtrC family decaheme c-type cytochrome